MLPRTSSCFALLIGLALIITGSTTPALAAADTADDLVLYAPANGTTFELGEQPALPESMAPAALLGPIDALNCNITNNASHVVTTYQAKSRAGFSGGRIKLECGNEKSGYRHIRLRHQADWTKRMQPLQASWDDFMDFATRQSLAAPSKTDDQGDGRLCYTTPVQIRNSKGAVVKTFSPRVMISTNNRRVITSIPGGGC